MSRGRGKAPRGRGFGSQLEALGITSAGDSAPPPILQPPPLFPPLDRKPLELKATDVDQYLLEVKQELRAFMRESVFYLVDDSDAGLNHVGTKARVERGAQEWVPDWQYFPKELEAKKRKVKKTAGVAKAAKPKMAAKTVRKLNKVEVLEPIFDESEVLKAASPKNTVDQSLLEGAGKPSNESEEKAAEKEGEEKDSEEEGAGDEEEYYDEEMEEEGTDYNLTYFDPGEEYGDDDDGGDEREGTYY
eukprot:Em0005g1641a